MTTPTKLSYSIIDLVTRVAGPLGHHRVDQVTDQARKASVVGFTPTWIELQPGLDVQRVSVPDGTLPWWATVELENRVSSDVMLWFKDGWLVALEQPWYGDDPPLLWPLASQVIVKGPSQTISEEYFPEVARWFREHPAEGLPTWYQNGRAPWGSRR